MMRTRSRAFIAAAFLAVAMAPSIGAHADDANNVDAKQADTPPTGIPDPSIATSFPAIADPAGIRSAFAAKGVQFQLNYIGEVLGNVSGGEKQGAIYEGRLEMVIDIDTSKLLGIQGGTIHANVYQIHGNGLSRTTLDNLATVSSIEAVPATRLYEAWYQQKLADDKLSIRVGQLAADTEFDTTAFGGLFINSTFGWPTITAIDLPSGGPAYPLATPGVRLEVDPDAKNAVLIGVYNGDPAGPGAVDPQIRDNDGLAFRLQDAPFVIGEVQHKYELGGGNLPGTIKLGAWAHFGGFDDLRFGADGLSLANPASNGVAVRHSDDYAVYGVIDQQVYKLASADDPQKGVGLFGRFMVAPQDDRNPIDFQLDAGINFNGMIPVRPDDSFGLAFSYDRISPQAAALDIDRTRFGTPTPVRDYEAVVEASYQAQIVPGWTVQPDFQYIIHPGGGIANPLSPTGAVIKNAAVFGLRTTINY